MTDTEAFLILGSYIFYRGLIKPINKNHIETPLESKAINHLCAEWDYACDEVQPREIEK